MDYRKMIINCTKENRNNEKYATATLILSLMYDRNPDYTEMFIDNYGVDALVRSIMFLEEQKKR